MNPTLTLLLPMLLGQPMMGPAGPGCGPGCGPMMPGMPGMVRPVGQPCPPMGPPAPVLAMKALLPDGVTINVLPGLANSKAYPHDSTFGFRPGYSYPIEIKIPGKDSLFPVLEVRGSIVPRPGMKYMEITAPLLVTKFDIERVQAGGYVQKVIYLEDPTKAVPEAAQPDSPIELNTDTPERAENEARDSGRIVAILRIGDRIPTAEDLARLTVTGAILLPGENKLGLPSMPPHLPCWSVPLFDPIAGPKPLKEECFLNGGDGQSKLGIGFLGRVGGLDPTDVVGEYTLGGRRKVTTTNVVCICSPRFIIRRADITPHGFEVLTATGHASQAFGRNVFVQRAYTESAIAREKSLSLIGKDRPSAAVALTSLHAFGGMSKPQGFATDTGIKIVASAVEPEETTNLVDLILTKSIDPPGPVAQGTTITITIKYANYTRRPVTDLVISDSLSGRLEYVPGSSAADRPSNVTTTANEAGSVIVRFDLPGTIQPGTSGLVQFKVKIR